MLVSDVRYIVIRHLYALQRDHYGKSNNHLLPYIGILLTVFLMLYITSPGFGQKRKNLIIVTELFHLPFYK